MAEGTRGLSIFRRQNKEGEDVVIEDDHVSADLSNYHLLNSIGVGAYAKVYRAQVKSTGAEVASKIINRQGTPKDYVKKFLPREIEVLQKLEHPNCIRTYEIIEYKQQIHMIMEVASNGDLLDYINSRGRISEPTAQKIFSQLVSALEYFYSINIAHRDLKCENLLLDRDFNIKVSDFGFATPYRDGQLLHTFCGSVAYACPEILYGQPYDGRTSDLWSIGVVLYALVCGQLPYQEGDMKRLLMQINSPLIFPSRLSFDCTDLLRQLLSTSLIRRATLKQVKLHNWLLQGPRGGNLDLPLPDRGRAPTSPKSSRQTSMSPAKTGNSRNRSSTIDASELGAMPKIAGSMVQKLSPTPVRRTHATVTSPDKGITTPSSSRSPTGTSGGARSPVQPARASSAAATTRAEAYNPPQPQQHEESEEECPAKPPEKRRGRAMSNVAGGGSDLPRQMSWRKRLRNNINSYLMQEAPAIEEE
eukprot:scpid52163/ scgid14014/ Testis-specific serine/threonine-protein kinase 2; Serine/threonine-protein kinase 22B